MTVPPVAFSPSRRLPWRSAAPPPGAIDRKPPRLPAYQRWKRVLDIVGAALAILCLSPLWAGIALAIWAEDRGPVLFRQTRIGLGGRPFQFLKFRSMVADAERRRAAATRPDLVSGGIRFKDRHDPRVTRVGRWLRRYSLDELPQLWHVLRGDMSLVGPRPPLPQEVVAYDDRQWLRLLAKPGLTCLWQVLGRSERSFPHQVRLDLLYMQRQSWRLDLAILWRTLPAVCTGRGAW